MQYEAVMVFTGESAEQIISTGRTGNWKAKMESLQKRRYVVAVHNRRSEWGDAKGEHGAAFLICRIKNIQDSTEPTDNGWRKSILIDSYAHIDVHDAWPKGHRNPVAYKKLKDLGIDPDKLEWTDITHDEPAVAAPLTSAAAIDQARQLVARAFSVDPSKVRISVDV